MHEMPFTQAILDLALKSAEGRSIRRIRLRVGRLSAIVPESVEVFFKFLSRETPAEGAELVFEMDPIGLKCRRCGKSVTVPHHPEITARQALSAACRKGCDCGNPDFTVTGGLGFDMIDMEVG
jgi:hydrogenase nickel incorporation protein HypA/HybF